MSLVVLLFIIGFIGSFISGMVGIGGAIINYPMILYIPVLLGFTGYTSHEVSGITAVQVFFATFAGAWAYRKSNDMNKTLVMYMGASILIGSFIGSFGANILEEHTVNVVYAALATIAAIMMFVPKQNNSGEMVSKLVSVRCRGSFRHYRSWRFVPFSSHYASYFKITTAHDDRNIYRYYVYFLNRDYYRKSDYWASSYHSSSNYCGCQYICCATWSTSREEAKSKSTAICIVHFNCRHCC